MASMSWQYPQDRLIALRRQNASLRLRDGRCHRHHQAAILLKAGRELGSFANALAMPAGVRVGAVRWQFQGPVRQRAFRL
jgi:hypothetical protein